jgi:hypothetical protein
MNAIGLIVASSVLLVTFAALSRAPPDTASDSRRVKTSATLPPPLRFYRNPKIRRKRSGLFSKPDPKKQIYVAILDSQYRSSSVQCRVNFLWAAGLSQSKQVEAVEFYTNHSWVNRDCDVRPVVVPPAPFRYPVHRYSGCWVILSVFEIFLERATANYIFVIDDSAYVRVPTFLDWLQGHLAKPRPPDATGFCYELRDYFRLYMTGTGILLSRQVVQRFLTLNETWDVMCQCEVRAEEAIGHALMELSASGTSQASFLGQPFVQKSDYEVLLSKRFDGLPPCWRPRLKTRVCVSSPFRLDDVIVWNGLGKDVGIEQFLQNAEASMSALPPNIRVSWTKTKPWLCREDANDTTRGPNRR